MSVEVDEVLDFVGVCAPDVAFAVVALALEHDVVIVFTHRAPLFFWCIRSGGWIS